MPRARAAVRAPRYAWLLTRRLLRVRGVGAVARWGAAARTGARRRGSRGPGLGDDGAARRRAVAGLVELEQDVDRLVAPVPDLPPVLLGFRHLAAAETVLEPRVGRSTWVALSARQGHDGVLPRRLHREQPALALHDGLQGVPSAREGQARGVPGVAVHRDRWPRRKPRARSQVCRRTLLLRPGGAPQVARQDTRWSSTSRAERPGAVSRSTLQASVF